MFLWLKIITQYALFSERNIMVSYIIHHIQTMYLGRQYYLYRVKNIEMNENAKIGFRLHLLSYISIIKNISFIFSFCLNFLLYSMKNVNIEGATTYFGILIFS